MSTTDYNTIAIVLLFIIISISIQTALVMVIFNNIVIKKLPSANIQPLSFFDALAISILFALLGGAPIVVNKVYKNCS
jgi:hypothetical protein